MTEPDPITSREWVIPDYLCEIIEEAPDVAAELLNLYLENATDIIGKLTASTQQQDADTVSALAHTLRGSTLQLGADDIAEIAGDIEANAGRADWTVMSGSVMILKSMLDALHTEIQKSLHSFQSR